MTAPVFLITAESDPNVTVTFFQDLNATSKKPRNGSWSSFVKLLGRVPTYNRKEQCELIKLATFGDLRTHKNSLRHDANIEKIYGVEGDYDAGLVSVDEAERRLRNASIEAALYTTPSHSANAPRWRVLAPLSKSCVPAERLRYAKRLDNALGGILAKESFAVSQCFYSGRVEGVEYDVRRASGSCIDLLDKLDETPQPQATDLIPIDERVSDEELIRQITSAENYHAAMTSLSARYAGRGMRKDAIVETLLGLLRANSDTSPRARERLAEIPRIVASAVTKFSSPASFGDIRNGGVGMLPLTEVGNSDRLAQIVSANARFVPEAANWVVWHNGAWQHDGGRSVMTEHAKGIVTQLNSTAVSLIESNQTNDAQKVLAAARGAQTTKMIDAAIDLLARKSAYRMPLAHFDADALLVGYDGARRVIDLTTGETREAVPADYVTKSLGIAVVGEAAKAKIWQQFLDDVFDRDAELIAWLHRWCGYLLTGKTSEQCLLFLYGHGANGKSVFVETLAALLGEYSRVIGSETLLNTTRNAQSASPDLARLVGARLATSVETEDGKHLAESLIKSITGGDKITARHLHREPFEFAPAFKLIIAGNHKPVISGTDFGIWRRMHLVPFTQTFGEGKADPNMLNKLRAELPHIAAWCVDGAVAWQRDGLGKTPQRVRDATLEYREAMDTVGEFIRDCCELEETAFTETASLFERYQRWCRDCGLHPPTLQRFARRLGERSELSRERTGRRGFRGIRLRDTLDGTTDDARDLV